MSSLFSTQKSRQTLFYLALAVLAISFVARPAVDPGSVRVLMSQHMEYTAIEQSTWIIYVMAGFLSLYLAAALRKRGQKHTDWKWAGFGFIFIALEEISWGGRWLRFPYPVILGETVDGLLDIPFLVRKTIFGKFLFSQKLIFAFLFICVILILMLWKRGLSKRLFQRALATLPARLIFAAGVLLMISRVLDLQVIPNPIWARSGLSFLPPTYVEECLECLASFCCILAVVKKTLELNAATLAQPALNPKKETTN